MNLNPKQFAMIKSTSKITGFVGGLGCGKTFTLGADALVKVSEKGSFGLLTAPVYGQLHKYTLNEVQSVWENHGLYEGNDFVINKKPPNNWGVKPFSQTDNNGILTTKWGSYMQIKEAYNFNQFRASEFDYILFDEFREAKAGALEVLLGRLRGKRYKELNKQHTFSFYTTPPDDISEIHKLEEIGANIIQSITADNLHNLPTDYIEIQRQVLDEITYRREILGEMIPPNAILFYCFDNENIVDKPFQNITTFLSFDFNVNPMTCVLVQENTVIKEFEINNSNTYDLSNRILRYLEENNFSNTIYITGDYSGNRNESSSSKTDYQIIKDAFKRYLPDFAPVKTKVVKRVEDRFNTTNSAFKTYSGERKLFINKSCEKLIKYLRMVTRKDYKRDDFNRTHLTDCLTYYAYNYIPITPHTQVYI